MLVELNSSKHLSNEDAQRIRSSEVGAIPKNSDGQLMARIAAGNELAFQELVKVHGMSLARLIGRLTAWHADRDDLLQETLLAVWDNACNYDEQGTLKSWLQQIAVNRVKNHFRAIQRLKRRLEHFAHFRSPAIKWTNPDSNKREVCPSGEDPDSPLARSLKRLAFADRKLLVLYYLEEIPAEQISRAENIRIETLHVRLHRARKRLKQELENLEQNHDR